MFIDNDLVRVLYGEKVEYAENDVIQFETGILGFEYLKRFVVFDTSEDGNGFYFLQSLEDLNISFTIVNPFLFVSDYEFELNDDDKDKIGIDSVEKLAVFCIVNVKQELENTTMNLKAPILINVDSKKASQVIIEENYDITHKFLDMAKK